MLIREDITKDIVFRPKIVYPDVNFLRADMGLLVEKMKLTLSEEQWQYFTDCGRVIKDPHKASGFLTMWFQASQQGRHNLYNLNYKSQIQNILSRMKDQPVEVLYNGIRVEMMFLGNGCTNKALHALAEIGRQALPNTRFVTIDGDSAVDGKKFKGENAEQMVWKVIKECSVNKQNVMLLGVNMPSRSFSIYPIQVLHLFLDGGAEWSVAQKLARALTRAPFHKQSFIIDWSFDPNRSSVVDSILLSTALDIAKQDKTSMPEAMKKVLRTFNIFEMGEDEPYQWTVADYLKKVFESNTVGRVIGDAIIRDNFDLIPEDIKQECLGVAGKKEKKMDKVFSGKENKDDDNDDEDKKDKSAPEKEINEMEIVKQVLVEMINHMPKLVKGCDAQTLEETFLILEKNNDFVGPAETIMPLKISSIKKLYELGIISSDRIELELLRDE